MDSGKPPLHPLGRFSASGGPMTSDNDPTSKPVSGKDRLFAEQDRAISDFDFGESTARVFDDMLDRSIPQYGELQRMIGELAGEFATPGSRVYDLGCSTGLTLKSLDRTVDPGATLVGVDYSPAMLEKARDNLSGPHQSGRLRLEHADLNDGI
ncbi:MAG TPA: hypothetical protein DD411_01475, partial [Alcanivorax sp.]|nr:hypothetical protein [Alcanivorax sp.]